MYVNSNTMDAKKYPQLFSTTVGAVLVSYSSTAVTENHQGIDNK